MLIKTCILVTLPSLSGEAYIILFKVILSIFYLLIEKGFNIFCFIYLFIRIVFVTFFIICICVCVYFLFKVLIICYNWLKY